MREKQPSTAYEMGAKFWTDQIGMWRGEVSRLTDQALKHSSRPETLSLAEAMESFELSKMKLAHLKRRKRIGLIK